MGHDAAAGRYVMVTGGARNIGRAIVERLHADGYAPITLDLVDPEAGVGEFHRVDLSRPDAVARTLETVLARRPVTRLVNCVGIVKPALLEDVTMADFDAVIALNLRCAVQCVQALVPGMREQRFGRIVSISSRTALGKELRTSYSASKAALHGVTKTWALELAADGITANAVAPGTIETTAFYQNNPRDDPRTQAIIDAIPARRIGTPADVAQAVSFFLDDRSSFVNGQILYVCGGLTVGRAN
jgi:NAD(P)-dependent dehydrogenase (short-subunit alcohol dehydrogenase family)